MKKKHKVITLCGSTRFKDKFIETQRKLALEGNIVFSLDFFDKSEGSVSLSDKDIELLTEIHKGKIKLSDEIFVINVDGYVGSATKDEIAYALSLNKKVAFLESIIRFHLEIHKEIAKLYCPFCKAHYSEETAHFYKNTIRMICRNCKRCIVS
jgi:hypothetical protein